MRVGQLTKQRRADVTEVHADVVNCRCEPMWTEKQENTDVVQKHCRCEKTDVSEAGKIWCRCGKTDVSETVQIWCRCKKTDVKKRRLFR